MDGSEDMTKKADQYAKRLLVRKKDPNQSFEAFSKSLRRRKKIMDAISRNKTTVTTTKPSSNMMEKAELANSRDDAVDKSYVSTWPSDEANLSVESSCVESTRRTSETCTTAATVAEKSHKSPKNNNNNNNNNNNRRSSCECFTGLVHALGSSPTKLSLGEYFGAKSQYHKEMRKANFLSESCEREFEYYNVDARKRKAEQEYFEARVLDVLEPQVLVRTPRPSINFRGISNDGLDSTAAMVSEGLEQLRLLEQQVPETPKTSSVYPNLASMERRMSDRCTKKLFQDSDAQTPTALDDDQAFSTALEQRTCQTNRVRNRPNLESTRQAHCTMSPWQNGTCTISTLSLPNTPANAIDCNQLQFSSAEKDQQLGGGLPLEVQNFLKIALGDEYYAESTLCNGSDSRANAIDQLDDLDGDATSPKSANALNRSLSACKTLSRSIRRKFKKRNHDNSQLHDESAIRPPRCSLASMGNEALSPDLKDSIKRILDLMEVHQTQIYQASKALDLCNSMREFETSMERVELERLLRVASLGKTSAREEIRRCVSFSPKNSQYCERAQLSVDRLSLRLEELAKPVDFGLVEWFVIVVSEGLNVWATRAVALSTTNASSDVVVNFPGRVSLASLAPDFQLHLAVYSMRLRPRIYNHEDKYHIRTEEEEDESTGCPSPQKLLLGSGGNYCNSADKRKNRVAVSPRQFRCSGLKESAFSLCASLELRLDDLARASSTRWPLKGSLQASLDMDLKLRVQLSARHSGFLTQADEAGGLIAWSRRWCVLEGASLLLWNYPREQEDGKSPIYVIDLTACVSRRVELVDRKLCPRPRTLLIETTRRRCPADEDSMVYQCGSKFTIVRHLLSCDTQQDLIVWNSKLNHVVAALREWNLLDNSQPLQISDL